MIGITSSTETLSAYVCTSPVGGMQDLFSSDLTSFGLGSVNVSASKSIFVDFASYMPLVESESSSRAIKINDMLIEQRRILYDMLANSPLDDDSQPQDFFEEMRNTNDDSQCFNQIMKIFLGAYKKRDDSMIIRTLRFMQHFKYDEIGQVGVSAARMSLLDSKNLDIQSAALSLVLCWKSSEFRDVIADYHVPKDPFIKIKMQKVSEWYTLEK